MKAKEAEAKDYKDNVDNGPTTGGTGRYEGTQNLDTSIVTPVAKTEPPKASLEKGSYVEVKSGTRWYGDSYGGGASGKA